MSVSENGICSLTVERLQNLLSSAYISIIKNGRSFREIPSAMLWGAPGVGKSQCVREIARAIERGSGRRAVVTDVRLMLFNPVDLRGIPTANADRTLAVWLKPEIFRMDEDEGTVNILFLDEISAASPSVQAAAYQITLDRKVGEHELPDNCIVIAAGNRVTDRSVAYSMPKALANRLCHFEIETDPHSWHDWAISAGIHKYVVGYLEYNTAALMKFDPSASETAFPTPRSWEMVSNILNGVSDDVNTVFPMIAGSVGYSAASGLISWAEIYAGIPSVTDIFAGEDVDFPFEKEHQIALRSAMVEYARKNPDRESIDNSIEYACRYPWQFRKALLHDYSMIPEVRPVLESIETYADSITYMGQ